MNRETAFFQHSVAVAAQFLQTAVVIDDRAFDVEDEPELEGEIVAPPTPTTAEPRGPEPALTPTPSTRSTEVAADPEPDRLDPKPVIDGFASHGIVCSVLHREPNDRLVPPRNRLSRLADVADILVIDWQIHRSEGESAEETLELLETAVRQNVEETPRKLRLIAVYTGEIDLLGVAERIQERLEARLRPEPVQLDGPFAFRTGAVRIVVLGKKTVAGRTPEAKSQEVDFDELASRTITEFACMTAGLVSNVALTALTRIRLDTHRILDRFSPRIDAAFLVHRALLESQQEADEHLAPIIAAELQAIIQEPGTHISDDEISEWLIARQMRHSTHTEWGFAAPENEQKLLLQLCTRGCEALAADELPKELRSLKEISPPRGCAALDRLVEFIGGPVFPDANEELAMLMGLNTRYSAEPPHLTLGTVMLLDQACGKSFWLCLQPSCDSVRLKRPRDFPLLRLSQSNDKFGIVVRVGTDFVRLRIDPRPFKLQTVSFKPDKSKDLVLATTDEEGRHWFQSRDETRRYQWIGELKFEHAQRAVQAFASQNSRVGLTESEWQRRRDLGRGDG